VNVPEEFLDPILGEIMRDPVKLPISNVMDYLNNLKLDCY
jgi:hypothetical protein